MLAFVPLLPPKRALFVPPPPHAPFYPLLPLPVSIYLALATYITRNALLHRPTFRANWRQFAVDNRFVGNHHSGIRIIYISHRLKEIFELADAVAKVLAFPLPPRPG